eukprot:COSAG02_NODE_1265_length_13542_cov_5.803615_11_plen_39_part_00
MCEGVARIEGDYVHELPGLLCHGHIAKHFGDDGFDRFL